MAEDIQAEESPAAGEPEVARVRRLPYQPPKIVSVDVLEVMAGTCTDPFNKAIDPSGS